MMLGGARAYVVAVAMAACTPGAGSPSAECMGDSSEPRGDPAASTLSHALATAAAVIAEPPDTSSALAARLVQLDAIATLSISSRFEIEQGDAARRRSPAVEWAREMDLLRRASIPPERIVLRAFDGGVVDVRVALLVEPVNAVVEAIARAGAAELARIEAAPGRGRPSDGTPLPGRILRESKPSWTRIRFGFKRFYCDYGGTAWVDFHVRAAKGATLAIVMSSRGGDDGLDPKPVCPDILASVAIDEDEELVPRALDLWRSVVTRVSNVSPEVVADRLVETKPAIVTTTKAKWLEIRYVERHDWLRLEGLDRIPLVVFSGRGRSFDAPSSSYDALLDSGAIAGLVANAESPMHSELHVAHVAPGRLAFASDAAAREAFRRAFGAAPSETIRLANDEPAMVGEQPQAHVLDPCRTRTLSLRTGKSSLVFHDCPRGQ